MERDLHAEGPQGHRQPEGLEHRVVDWERFARFFRRAQVLFKIVTAYEADIQRRWFEMTPEARLDLLLRLWPNMPEQLLPLMTTRPKSTTSTGYGETFWPQITSLPLSSHGELLLLMLNSRGRNHPASFARPDLKGAGMVAQLELSKLKNILDGYFNSLREPRTYRSSLELYFHRGYVHRIYAFTLNAGPYLLDIQEPLYDFLIRASRAILPAIPSEETLVSSRLRINPEPRPASPLITSFAKTIREAPYRLPARADLVYMLTLIDSKRREAEDHLWALQHDPGYFVATYQEWANHRYALGPGHVSRMRKKQAVWAPVLDAVKEIHDSRTLQQRLLHLVKMDGRHPAPVLNDDLPPGYREAFILAHFYAEKHMVMVGEIIQNGALDCPAVRSSRQTGNAAEERGRTAEDFFTFLTSILMGGAGETALIETVLDEFYRTHLYHRDWISPWVARKMSAYAVFFACTRQLRQMNPWAQILSPNWQWMSQKSATVTYVRDHDVLDLTTTYMMKQKFVKFLWNSVDADDTHHPHADDAGDADYSDVNGCTGDPFEGRFEDRLDYPVDRPWTEASVQQMLDAQSLLDKFWQEIWADLKRDGRLPRSCMRLARAPGTYTPVRAMPAMMYWPGTIFVSEQAKEVFDQIFRHPAHAHIRMEAGPTEMP